MPLPSECNSVETVALKQTSSTTVVLKSCDLISPVQPLSLNYTWSRDGAPLDLTGTRFTVNQYGLLTIENITRADLGVYQVSISNIFGSALHSIKLVAASSTSSASRAPGAIQSQISQGELITIVTLSHTIGFVVIDIDPQAHTYTRHVHVKVPQEH